MGAWDAFTCSFSVSAALRVMLVLSCILE